MSAPNPSTAATSATSVSVQLSDIAEERLRRQASEDGLTLEQLARKVLEREAGVVVADPATLAWVAEWRAWTASRQKREIFVDDSRDSIYQGCGE